MREKYSTSTLDVVITVENNLPMNIRCTGWIFSVLLCFSQTAALRAVASLDIEEAEKSVVRLVLLEPTPGPGGGPEWSYIGHGTGFFINREGQFVTNCHVFASFIEHGENRVAVAMRQDGSHVQFSDIRLIAYDEFRDLAVGVAVDFRDTVALAIAQESPRKGTDVAAIGFPAQSDDLMDLIHGFSGLAFSGQRLPMERTGNLMSASVKKGNVEDVKFMSWPGQEGQGKLRLVQNNAPIEPGNSGGPLIDMATGEVVGVVAAFAGGVGPRADYIRLAVDGSELRGFLRQNNIQTAGAAIRTQIGGKLGELSVGKVAMLVALGLAVGAGLVLALRNKLQRTARFTGGVSVPSVSPISDPSIGRGTRFTSPPPGPPSGEMAFARAAPSQTVVPPPPPAVGKPRTVILEGKARGGAVFRYEIPSELWLQNPGGLLLGSGDKANIEIHDPSLRPVHARILLMGSNEIRFSGIGTAPVFVDGSSVPAGGQPVLLKNGTRVQIGEITFTVAIAT